MKAALYIRVSTSYQIDKDSLPVQRQDLINYAKYAFNIDDYEIFEDAGFSGKDTNRPAFQDMMKRIKSGEFSHLFVWKIDRVSRNLLDFCDMYEDLKKYNCTFVSKNEQFDTGSAMGEAMLKIILVFAELERKLTAERVTSIMLARAEKGLWNGSRVPLGYDWCEETKYPVINKEEAKTVELIFKLYEKEKSTIVVATYMNKNNFKTKYGGTWVSKTICDILRNPFYKGTLRYNYRKSARKGKVKDESEWIVKDDNHEAIISKDLWQKCNDILDSNATIITSKFRRTGNVHIFQNLFRCSECGLSFASSLDSPRKDGYRPSRYRCMSHLKGDVVCNQRIVTDVTVGDFIFKYILNFIKSCNMTFINTAALETSLLKGDLFEGVSIDEGSLIDTLFVLDSIEHNKDSGSNDYRYNNEPVSNVIRLKAHSEIDSLKAAVNRLEKASERLTNIYLFSDYDMSEKDYILKKNEFDNKIKKHQAEIKELEEKGCLPCDDLSFLDNMDDFLFRIDVGLNIRELSLKGKDKILKDFFSTVIDYIIIGEQRVQEIHFKNGLIHKFIYK